MSSKGQTLMELVIVVAVIVIVVGALVFATIASLRNAQFAKNQAQATKLAQEGIERVRSIRDRNESIVTTITLPLAIPQRNIDKFSELWTVKLSNQICNTPSGDTPCYFRFTSTGTLSQVTSADYENVDVFKRQILIGDDTITYDVEKTITVKVLWTDFAGEHESRLTTILRRL